MHLDPAVENSPVASLDSLRLFQDYHWLTVCSFWKPANEQLGEAGRAAAVDGFAAGGEYRGLAMRDTTRAIVEGRSPAGVFQHWESAEWALAAYDGELSAEPVPGGLRVLLDALPGREYALADDCLDGLVEYWRALFPGIARGYDTRLAGRVEVGDDGLAPVFEVVDPSSETVGAVPAPEEFASSLNDETTLLELTRRTTGLLAAIQLNASRVLSRRFDASGEKVIRQAGHLFGSTRGAAIRHDHQTKGIPLTLESFMGVTGLQKRDPSEAVFVFADDQYLSPGAWYADCTYCPLAEVWGSEAKDGYRLGSMFDASNHLGLYQAYNPETVVRWDAVKSRGDSVCKFRFTIPSLMTADDPTPEEFDAGAHG